MALNSVIENLAVFTAMPELLPLALAAATFLLEDAATVAGALLAAQKVVSVEVAFASLLFGIVLGDAGLYWIGRLAATWPFARRVARRLGLNERRETAARGLLSGALIRTVFASRFVPGLRLPTYLACGYLKVSFARFMLAVVLASAAWTTALFYAVFQLGVNLLETLGPWKIPAAIALAVAVLLLPHLLQRLIRRPVRPPAPAPAHESASPLRSEPVPIAREAA